MAGNPSGGTAAVVGGFWTFPFGMERMLDKMASIGDNARMAKKRPMRLTDQLRQAIDDSGLTRYRIAKETGINEAALSKFYLGQRGLSMKALNALGAFLKLKITLGRKPDRKGK
jgi:hypothetical protein